VKLSIPLYVEERRGADEGPAVVVRPLFFEGPVQAGETLARATTRLVRDVRLQLGNLGSLPRHEALSKWSFCPEVDEEIVACTVELGQKRFACRWLVVAFHDLGRRIAFTPSVPDVWFEVARGESVADRAREALVRHFRDLARSREGTDFEPRHLGDKGRAWTTTVELGFDPPDAVEQDPGPVFAMLGGAEVRHGSVELADAGRCLDWLYPDDLDRAVERDREVEELARLLAAEERRPVLLGGPRMSGKTTVVHEHVYRRVARRRAPFSPRESTWLLAPQRLISGMSFVGQWENRLLAILDEAKRRDHTLYFDDLVGLFAAGTHRDSGLGVAHVLKPYVERRDVRVLGEITPEALRVLRELDRGFADLFHVIPVDEMDDDRTLRALLAVVRKLERSARCTFEHAALAAVLDLQRRFGREAAFPGKAAIMLEQLAVKYRGAAVGTDQVYSEFEARTGLPIAFVDPNVGDVERAGVIGWLEREVIGQRAALEAAADVVCVARARLNDPGRPIGTLLFLGPTGVGKTETAKALASYLFGDPERVVRFDMNEFGSHGSAARLAGTLDQPEGLLTGAIRRQPFAVVLLDEIEKAAPEVFDLLLQVLGEGRLTDAVGRTADLTKAIVVMTSNLGVRDATTHLGFRQDEAGEGAAYVRAAERYFRPELFNRIDRIVPFERLRREEVGRIARKLLRGVFARDGLARRRCVLDVHEAALDRIVDAGFHPTLGARALKRAIERELTAPVAQRLAALSPNTPTIVRVAAGPEPHEIAIAVEALVEAGPLAAPAVTRSESAEALTRLAVELERIERALDASRPDGPLDVDDIDTRHERYFALREQLQRTMRVARRASGATRTPGSTGGAAHTRRSHRVVRSLLDRGTNPRTLWLELLATDDVAEYVRNAFERDPGQSASAVDDARREAALLRLLAESDGPHQRARISVRWLAHGSAAEAERLVASYGEAFEQHLALKVTRVDAGPGAAALDVRGLHAADLARSEAGTHLFLLGSGAFVPVAVEVCDDGSRVDEPARSFPPVVRVYQANGPAVDLRTGLTTRTAPTPAELRTFILAMLPDLE
jgi:ATP-dependent Clp protease ATP-binding subunit ClpA